MSDLADRHSGTLGGRLNELGTTAEPVTIAIEDGCAVRTDVQHAAWMLVNLLSRMAGIVTAIDLTGDDAPLINHVIPFDVGAVTLREGLQQGAETISALPVRQVSTSGAGPLLVVGPGGAIDGLRLHGEGWCGAVAAGAIASRTESRLPFGPYIAACLAAGEIFRHLRMPAGRHQPITGISFSAWDYTRGDGTIHSAGPDQLAVELDFGLAGVGAVGCALIHALWACPGLGGAAVIADSDTEGIDTTNLNRCVIFNQKHVGALKASTAAEICADAGVAWEPVDRPYLRTELPRIPALIVSAVDKNRSRDQIQQGFWPGRLLGASTKDLRAEILRCGPPAQGPCLRCYNPPETDVPTDVRREQLRGMSAAELESFAVQIGHAPALVRRWANQGGCSEIADAALKQFREQDEPPSMFAVGFVSALAGVLLACELVKEHLGRPSVLDDTRQTVKFQFWNPEVASNGRPQRVMRDPTCPACSPSGAGAATWAQRALRWHAARDGLP